jgi:hypothetical protein
MTHLFFPAVESISPNAVVALRRHRAVKGLQPQQSGLIACFTSSSGRRAV